ncbi:UDP-N-acetylmuramoylalanine--D-glutamate ligase [Minicystis rosea]|nr:UDP-N-acetylmuramoylalanine--D-glutamate ligase [Minicystis rosea]
MDVQGKTAIVIGLGRSGVAAANLLLSRGARVIANDAVAREKLSADALALEAKGAEIVAGSHPESIFTAADFVIISPGVPSFPALEAFEKSGREVIGELELAARHLTAPIALIGGTNGKSTTTALVAAMCEAAGKKTFIGGNFGQPPAEVVDEPWDVMVLEISSFQAERVPTLRAKVHALLNITDDHLDRYPDFQAYADAKGNPFEHMTTDDVAVIPHGDPIVARQAARGPEKIYTFSISDAAADIALVGDQIRFAAAGIEIPASVLRISGTHNVANVCAAIGCAHALGVGADAIQRALEKFTGLGHRTVYVATIDGVRYYDDSKGTNVGASVAALRGLTEARAVLIAGGRDKLGDYAPLVEALRERGRALVLIGEAADRIEGAAAGVLPIARASSMQEAVKKARELALSGDAVLLSPACSSFDMFRGYAHRGDVFVAAVRAEEAGT